MNLFKRKKDIKVLFPQTEAVIEEAFEVGGVMYYRFADINNLEYRRGLMAFAVYNELDMRCSRNFLMKHVDAVDTILKSNEIDIYKIKALNNQLKVRLSMTSDIELMYKLASVVYFDENENPANYDQEYCAKKIEHWKRHTGVADFFLTLPLVELMPFSQTIEGDLDTYSELNRQLNEIHLALIQSANSKKE